MNLADLTTSRWGIALASILGRLLPLRTGLVLANWMGERLANRPGAPDVQAVRFNHQTLEGESLSAAELDARVRAIFCNAARGVVEVLHFQHRPAQMLQQIDAGEAMLRYISLTRAHTRQIVFTCPHTGNFDLAGRSLGLMGLQAFILSDPTQRADYNYENRLRRQTGLRISTISMESLKAAAKFLEDGGSVLTGVDWPIGEARFRPRFCGRPSLLPTAHVRLALKVDAQVVVVACNRRPDGKYFIDSSAPIQLRRQGSMADTILSNTEAILDVVEQYIRRDPTQWLLYRRVWEDYEPN